MNDRNEGHPCLCPLPHQRQLRQHEAGGRKAGPLRRRPALVSEREAAHEHGPGGGRPERILGGIVGEGGPPELASARGNVRKATGPTRLERHGLPEPGEHEPVTIGLLEAGEAVVRPASGQRRRRQVELRVDRKAHRRERVRRLPPRTCHGLRRTPGQRLPRLVRQRKRLPDLIRSRRHLTNVASSTRR
jgi:hypothetical protein